MTVLLYEMRLAPGRTVENVEAGAEDCRRQEFRLMGRWQAEKDGPMMQFKRRVKWKHRMMFGGKQMKMQCG